MKIIVDTSIWIEYFKNNPNSVKIIDTGLMENSIHIVGPVIAELIQGAKTNEDYDKLISSIDAVPYIDCQHNDWLLAGSISYKLRKNGITVPLTDLLIAAVSINNNAKIYTLDKHFKQIPDVLTIGI